MTHPLEGVRILTVEQYGAGPFGTMWLADQGAEVIKIEPPAGGDYARALGPYWFDNGDSQWFHAYNRNKKSLTLDLKAEAGAQAFRKLVKTADAVVSNLRGDVPERLGLTYKHLKDANPKIVCAHLSAYGRDGPRAAWPGFDYLMQAEAGWFSLTGEPDDPPTRFGLSVVDQMTGVALAYAALAGIIRARATGEGGDLDVSLFDVALSNLGYPAIWYLNAGHLETRKPRSAHPSLTPCQLYTTADGWIYLMCNKETFWPILCEALGRPEWAKDARFKTFKERFENRPVIQEMLDEALSKKTTAEWLAEFAGTVPAAPILDVRQALENPFVRDEGRLQDIALEGHGTYRYLRPAVQAAEPRVVLLVGGGRSGPADSPSFALYADRLVIFSARDRSSSLSGYLSARLREARYQALVSSIAPEALLKLADSYDVIRATDPLVYEIHVWVGGRRKTVSVAGHLWSFPGGPDSRAGVPPEFLRAYEAIAAFSAPATPWLPPSVEVFLHPHDHTRGEPVPWPRGWPSLESARVDRGGLHLIALPAGEFGRLRELLKSLEPVRGVRLGSRIWVIGYRLPFPYESAWMR